MTLPRPYSVTVGILLGLISVVWCSSLAGTTADVGDDFRIGVTKRGAGKQVIISQGAKEWFMLIEVTSENAVIIRQEKDHDQYIIDESETHDRPMTADEVDAAITDYINSVKTRAQKK